MPTTSNSFVFLFVKMHFAPGGNSVPSAKTLTISFYLTTDLFCRVRYWVAKIFGGQVNYFLDAFKKAIAEKFE